MATAKRKFSKEAVQIGRLFVDGLRECLTASQFREMRKRNGEETDPSICHSHDFCDANMIMCPAWEEVMKRETDAGNEADAALWSDAWAYAMAHGLTGKRAPAQQIHIARLETRNFEFCAYGRDSGSAYHALIQGLRAHGRQYKLDSAWFATDLEDIHQYTVSAGNCYRDYEFIK